MKTVESSLDLQYSDSGYLYVSLKVLHIFIFKLVTWLIVELCVVLLKFTAKSLFVIKVFSLTWLNIVNVSGRMRQPKYA